MEELIKNPRLVCTVDQPTKDIIISVIKDLGWGFCKEVVQNTTDGYELSIDVGNAKPVFCKNILYGTY